MLTLQKSFKFDGHTKDGRFSTLKVEVNYALWEYQNNAESAYIAQRQSNASHSLEFIQQAGDGTYRLDLPAAHLCGANGAAFAAYMQQVLQAQNPNLDDVLFNFDVLFSDLESGAVVGGQHLQALLLMKNPRSYAQALNGKDEAGGAHALAQPDAQPARAAPGIAPSNLYLLSKSGFDALQTEFSALTGYHEEGVFFGLVRQMLDYLDERSHTPLFLNEATLARMAAVLEDRGVPKARAGLDMLKKRFDKLFDFPLHVSEIRMLEVGGRLQLKPRDDKEQVGRDDFALYQVALEYSALASGNQAGFVSQTLDWSAQNGTVEQDSLSFAFADTQAIIANAVHSLVHVVVKAYDGAVVWSRSYKKDDPTLRKLNIVCALQRPNKLQEAETRRRASNKKLRGKLIAVNSSVSLKDVTVMVQARDSAQAAWRVVSAGKTDAFGNFVLPYPWGVYQAAQAVVELTPNSPAPIPVDPQAPDEACIADDFLYLMVQDIDEPPHAHDGGDDCGCKQPKNAPRLPDHNDLINSNEYSQDLGGSCMNLSTPNRTLREFNYQAIVRTSDPDVANYTLKKLPNGGYELSGGAAKLKRATVDLNNPIQWQDAPTAQANLSLYQAVTVATGHVLHFKSEFRADGYSLGDLLYSLALAPGQKKQVVVFDSQHSLRGAESQSLSQGERLSAGISDEREIVDQLGGGISEALRGSSNASTSGVSAGLGASGSAGFFGASLGVAGGYANANSQASQNSARNVSQYFSEKLRQSIMQNANSYRQLNATVVTSVNEGQHYSAQTEVVANHNHCHPLTMMYFEVLRHFAVYQELVDVEECIFVPLLMTNFTPHNINKWRDVLSRHMLPLHANTYLQPRMALGMGRNHPLLKAFDANDRILTNYANVDFPATTYDDEKIRDVKGELTLRVHLPRPKTRYDFVKSAPVISKTEYHKESDAGSVAKSVFLGILTGGLSLLAGDDGSKTVAEQVLARAKLFDAFMQMDANFETAPPAKCMRVVNFRAVSVKIWGANVSITAADFFEDSILDRHAWKAYATILGYADPIDMLEYYFKGRLIAEWDGIFYHDIVPVVYRRLIEQLHLDYVNADWTALTNYKGGEHLMRVAFSGSTQFKRKQLPDDIFLKCNNVAIKQIADQIKFVLETARITYATQHFHGVLFNGRVNNDLLDASGAKLYIPESEDEKRNPKKEDAYLVQKLVEHLNSNLEHYNKALWFNLDHDRRFMLLDGFHIQIYDTNGQPAGYRALASVVKNQLLSIVGNSLVFPVAAGYKISKSYIVEHNEQGDEEHVSLLEHYRPSLPAAPYRISVPSRGVFLEAVKGVCNACEPVEENTSQDWTKFTTDEPTPILPLSAPTPSITDYKPSYKDFAAPIVNIQSAPGLPAPGAGLAGLGELLGKAGIFNDITGLQGNQENALKTLQSNNENVRALAETSKGLVSQERNTSNSDKIMNALKKAKDSGGITQQEYGSLLKSHLQQLIDGGDGQKAEAEKHKPSLTEAAVKAAEQGKTVKAQKVGPEGGVESVTIEGAAPEKVLAEVKGAIPLLKQENNMACWATVATMMVNWQKQQSLSVPEVLASAGAIYLQKFNDKKGLSAGEKPAFLNVLGMQGEAPASYTVQQYIDWVNAYGPLWVTTDSSDASGKFSPHARILVKISGTGAADGVGTNFTFIDPASGSKTTESFAKFVAAYEQMVTDNPSDNLFVQIVHFASKAGAGKPGEGEGGPVEGAASVDKDARRTPAEISSQLSKYSGHAAGATVKIVADYVKSKLENVWNGKGGIIGMVDHGEHQKLVEYLGTNAVPATYSSAADKAKTIAAESFAAWDGKNPATDPDPSTWAYNRSFSDGGLPYCVMRFYKLVKPGYAKDYFPILAHEICHYLLFQSEALIEADTRDFLFDANVAQADRAAGAVARNRFIQEVVGRRLNYLVHKEIDVPATPDSATPAQIGKMAAEWAMKQTNGVDYYQKIHDFLQKLPNDAARRNQLGIWLQNFWSKVTMFDNQAFATKLAGDLNLAGEFLKKADDATYAAEKSDGIH
ncbi:papain-like cysteine protease family protein [Massilia sp. W12]|uniref:papain-like cysteine protease family protein n=1 Tax=Massilia sp. W12 TaxID=3126507 RepID=UPI0030CAD2E5